MSSLFIAAVLEFYHKTDDDNGIDAKNNVNISTRTRMDSYSKDLNSSNSKMLFHKIYNDIVLEELKIQKVCIRDEIANIENKYPKDWSNLRHSIENWNLAYDNNIQQCSLFENETKDIMSKGIQSAYSRNELLMLRDSVNGFDASKDYDHNGYLSRLLIESYKLDEPFQNQCKKIFQFINQKYNINCRYCKAHVKTKER